MSEETKRENLLPQPDRIEVYAKRCLEFVRANQKAIIMAVSAVVLVALIITGILYFQKRAEEKAQVLLGKAIARVDALGRSQGAEDEYTKIKPAFKEIIDKYGSTAAGKAARLKYADLCYRTGDYDKAVEMYQAALEAYEDAPDIQGVILNGLAYTYENMQAYDQAARYFKRIIDAEAIVMKDQALFGLARIYGKTGDSKKQQNAYEQLVSDYPDSMYYQLAREKLAG